MEAFFCRSYDDKKMSDLMMKVWGNFIKHGSPSPHPKGEKGGLKFTWTNYTEFNQEFAVLSLKPHMDKFFLTDRWVGLVPMSVSTDNKILYFCVQDVVLELFLPHFPGLPVPFRGHP